MKKNKTLLIILFLSSLFFGCTEKKQEVKEIKEQKTFSKFPVITDTVGVAYEFIQDEDNPYWLSTANYGFYFIGKLKDTVSFSSNRLFGVQFVPPSSMKKNTIKKKKDPSEKYYMEWGKEEKFEYCFNAKTEIQVKTDMEISNSYLVLLRNQTKDTLIIGYGDQIPLIMEAKDPKGYWKPIQEKFVFFCGTGLETIILPPKEIVLTLAPKFKGDYKTQFRLVLGDNTSEPFPGFINKRQFESRYDETGDYKEAYKKEMNIN